MKSPLIRAIAVLAFGPAALVTAASALAKEWPFKDIPSGPEGEKRQEEYLDWPQEAMLRHPPVPAATAVTTAVVTVSRVLRRSGPRYPAIPAFAGLRPGSRVPSLSKRRL